MVSNFWIFLSDMVGKTLGSTNANNAGTNGTAPKQTNGPEEKKTTPKPGGKASLPGKSKLLFLCTHELL